jgi:hypothetical protein
MLDLEAATHSQNNRNELKRRLLDAYGEQISGRGNVSYVEFYWKKGFFWNVLFARLS